jgi:hypothetical protein
VPGLNLTDSHPAAMGTNRRISRPANFSQIAFADLQIRKIADGVQQCFWGIHNFLAKSQPPPTWQGVGLKNDLFKPVSPVVCQFYADCQGFQIALGHIEFFRFRQGVRAFRTNPILNRSFQKIVGRFFIGISQIFQRQGKVADFGERKLCDCVVDYGLLDLFHIKTYSRTSTVFSMFLIYVICKRLHFLILSKKFVIDLFITINSIIHIGGVSSVILGIFNKFIKMLVSPYNCVGYEGINYA